MYRLFITNKNYSSWSLRPWVLMRTLGIDFEERLVPLPAGDISAEFRKFAPNGRVPCLHDADVVVWDSLAIVEYLAERHPGIWPQDARARAYARSASAEMHSGFTALRSHCSMTVGQRITLRERPQALQAELARLSQLWTDGLARFGGPWLAGAAFTAVDAFFAPVAYRLRGYGITLGAPCDEYAARLLALPAMQEWEHAALREPWRDEPHEQEIRAVAASIIDLRLPTNH